MSGLIHYEVFARKTPGSPWSLQHAGEDRALATELADEMLAQGRAAAVKVVKEIFDAATGEFTSVTVSSKGQTEGPARAREAERGAAVEPVCRTPDDMRGPRGRETIGRVLEDWLKRAGATPFELLHRADLVEKLEASGFELQHAVQKIALPESQASGRPVHEVIRYYNDLIEKTCERVLRDDKKKLFPDLAKEPLAEAVTRLMPLPDRAYRLSGAVAKAVAPARGWRDKTDRLLALADQVPSDPEPRKFALGVIEQPLSEIVGSAAGLADLLGADLDLGGALAALTRLAAPKEVEMLIRIEPRAARVMPELDGAAARLGARLAAGDFQALETAVAKRVLRELSGARRLRPTDPQGEIDLLRALAMAMTAAAGRALTLDEVQQVFVERSRGLVSPEFVTAYLGEGQTAVDEGRALVRLCENVAGAANKRQAARWLAQHLSSHKFETAVRSGAEAPGAKLALLADLQKSVRQAGLPELDIRPALERLGELGGLVEAENRLAAAIAGADAPLAGRLAALLKLAAGEAAPLGPAAARAKAEALRLIKAPEARAELAAAPELAAKLMPLLQSRAA